MSDARRPRRVAEQLRLYLTNALSRELADPRLSSLVVTSVDVPDDLSFAHVSVRLMVGDDDPKQRQAAVASLQRAAKRLRSSVAPRLGLRRVPELRFAYDAGHDATRRVEEILAESARAPSGSNE